MRINKIVSILSTCALATLFGTGISTAAPPVIMKVLVLAGSTSENSYQSITTFLEQIGVPYQAVALSSIKADSSGNRLSSVSLSNSATGQGLYQGIILTDSTFAACGSSCLSTTDWTTLNTYATEYSVRIASYYTDPAAQWGLVPASTGSYTAASPLNVTLTTAGAAVFPYLNSANAIAVAGQGTSAIRAYLATPTAAANETTTPLLTAGAYTVGVTHTTASGEQILALTMDNTPALLHSQAFAYGVINWVTNGVFLGSRQVYLNPEIDDMLLGNWIYAPALHPACEAPNTCPTYYETGPDLQAMANWQAGLQSQPQFQSYRGTYGVNGVGTTWFAASDPVFAAIKSLNTQFWWVSHTWDHPNLDCYTTTQSGACVPATLAQSLAELNQDIAVAPSLGITLDPIGMVTPFNSGLSSASFLQAAAEVGIRYIVYPQYPASPNTGIVNALVPSILEVTRMNNDLFYDVSSPLSGVYGSWPDEYNATYGPDGTTPTYSENQTYSQILNNLSQEFLQTNMLAYAPYPLAIHIANTATYDGTNSVFSDLMNATVAKYNNIFTLPVLSLNLENIATLLINRANYNASGVVGVYTPGVSVVLTTTKAATIPLTGLCAQASCGTYGGQVQDNIVMAAGSTVTIPLPAIVGVSLSSVAVNPSSVSSGTSATGTVTLSGGAPSGGVSVSLSSNSAAATAPASVTVAAGSTSATFTVSTSTVASTVAATLTASYSGVNKTAALTVTPTVSLSSVVVSPSSVTSGTSATGTVTLSGAAPSGGVSVSLASNNAAATTPASVTVAAGSTTATFTVSTSSVTSSVSATLTASYNSVSKTAALSVTPATTTVSLLSVAVSPSSVASGTSATGTVTLSGAAPSGGVSVSLASNNAAATTPASVTVAAGSTTATFTVSTSTVTSSVSATLTASYKSVSKTAALTVTPATATVSLSSVAVSPSSVASGTSTTGTVTLSGAAPSGGVSVSLSSNNASAIVPASVSVAAGSTSATFTVSTSTVTSSVSATLTATYKSVSKTAALTVTPATTTVSLSSVAVSPSSVASGTSTTGTVTLSGAAPSGGVSVSLSSNNASATVPASVSVAAGSTTATFTVTTHSVSSTSSDTITATYNSVSKTAALSVTPLASVILSSVSVSPTSIVSQASATGTVTISAAAPTGGIVIELWTTGTVAFVPASVTIAAGSTTATFTVTTNYTTSTLQDTVTAFYDGTSVTANVTVSP
jgi:hypothetical protein